MKNVITNESISFESTLGSPSKPHQCVIVQKPKPIFLVNSIEDNISLTSTKKSSDSGIKQNPSKQKKSKTKVKSIQKINPIKNNKNNEFHMLDFDALFQDIIIGKKKSLDKSTHKNISKKYNKKKLLGSKRIRLFPKNSFNKSK
jgi:hypothetical protein